MLITLLTIAMAAGFAPAAQATEPPAIRAGVCLYQDRMQSVRIRSGFGVFRKGQVFPVEGQIHQFEAPGASQPPRRQVSLIVRVSPQGVRIVPTRLADGSPTPIALTRESPCSQRFTPDELGGDPERTLLVHRALDALAFQARFPTGPGASSAVPPANPARRTDGVQDGNAAFIRAVDQARRALSGEPVAIPVSAFVRKPASP